MTTVSFFQVMMGLSTELERLSEAVERMHDLVCIDELASSEGKGRLIHGIQNIDHTTQVLTELARYAAVLALDGPADCHLQAHRAVASLRLSELQQRLVPGAAAPVQQSPQAGALELF